MKPTERTSRSSKPKFPAPAMAVIFVLALVAGACEASSPNATLEDGSAEAVQRTGEAVRSGQEAGGTESGVRLEDIVVTGHAWSYEVRPKGGRPEESAQSFIRIRGSAPISGTGGTASESGLAPVVYVDGVRVDDGARFGVGGAGRSAILEDIDPNEIERVEVLKGPAAEKLYGEEGANGVIQIFLKEDQRSGGLREQLGKVVEGIGEGVSQTGEGIKRAGKKIRKK